MTPNLVQEDIPLEARNLEDRFFFTVCQHGAERLIKEFCSQITNPPRFAFSRPGLVTFKFADEAAQPTGGADQRIAIAEQVKNFWPVRHFGHSLVNLQAGSAETLAKAALESSAGLWDAIHVFQRDAALPGERGFEPGSTELTDEVCRILAAQLEMMNGNPPTSAVISSDSPAAVGSRILDILLVEPNRWLVGTHIADSPHSCWPGGVIVTSTPSEVVSRAFFKMDEAIHWSGFPIQTGDRIVEIGSSPGGACQRLLDMGLRVTGIDPAEMDPLVAAHPNFTHWRGKSAQIKRKRYAGFKWLAADANVAPSYTLDFVEDIVSYPTTRLKGLLLTLKLADYNVARDLDKYIERIRSWGYSQVKVRQLASNRRECCVAASR